MESELSKTGGMGQLISNFVTIKETERVALYGGAPLSLASAVAQTTSSTYQALGGAKGKTPSTLSYGYEFLVYVTRKHTILTPFLSDADNSSNLLSSKQLLRSLPSDSAISLSTGAISTGTINTSTSPYASESTSSAIMNAQKEMENKVRRRMQNMASDYGVPLVRRVKFFHFQIL
jgi:hypothetical protein